MTEELKHGGGTDGRRSDPTGAGTGSGSGDSRRSEDGSGAGTRSDQGTRGIRHTLDQRAAARSDGGVSGGARDGGDSGGSGRVREAHDGSGSDWWRGSKPEPRGDEAGWDYARRIRAGNILRSNAGLPKWDRSGRNGSGGSGARVGRGSHGTDQAERVLRDPDLRTEQVDPELQPDEISDWRIVKDVQGEEAQDLPKRQRPFFNGVVLLADGIFKVLAVLFRDDLWRLNPMEKKDLAQAITGWVYAQPKRRAMYVIKFFTDVVPTLTLFLTVAGIMEVRLRTQAAKRNLMRAMLAAQQRGSQPAPTTREAPSFRPGEAPPVPASPVMPMPRMDGTIEIPERPDMPMNPLEELQAQLPM